MSWLESEIEKIENKGSNGTGNGAGNGTSKKTAAMYFAAGIVIAIVALIVLSVLWPPVSTGSVKVIRIEGEINPGNSPTGAHSEYIGSLIRNAADDPLVEAIVLRIDSQGGVMAAGEEIIADVEYAKTKKPVITSMGAQATSAAYHISSHTDRIFASPDTATAGIGVIITFYDKSRVYDREGVVVEPIKSVETKDAGADYRGLSSTEKKYMQSYVDASGEDFINDILAQRPDVSRDDIDTGRVIRGAEALELGLIDEIGNLYQAIDYAKNYKNNIKKDAKKDSKNSDKNTDKKDAEKTEVNE